MESATGKLLDTADARVELFHGLNLNGCRYIRIESELTAEETTVTAACCHGIASGSGADGAALSTLGVARNCRQCGFVL